MSAIDLNQDQLGMVRTILRKHLPDHIKVWLFGSRARGDAKPYSDIDLCVDVNEPLSLAVLAVLANDFEDSSLPYKVDVVDWHAIDEAFKKIVLQEGKQII